MPTMNVMMFAFLTPGYPEMAVVVLIALLLYGGNLPEVARSWGKTFAEFRRGLSGFQNELNEVIYSEPEQTSPQQLAYDAKYDADYGAEDDHDHSRDDNRLANGYDDSDFDEDQDVDGPENETKEIPHDQCVQDLDEDHQPQDSQPSDSSQTVSDYSADTVVIDPNEIDRKDKT